MKKYLILAVVFIIITVILLLPSSFTVSRQISLEQNPEQTYSYLMNLQNWSLWASNNNPNVTFDGLPGVVGSSISWQDDKSYKMILIHLREPNFIQFLYEGPEPEPSLEYFSMQADGTGTTLKWVVQKNLDNPIAKVSAWFDTPRVEARLERDLERLKMVIGETPPSY